MSGGAIGGQSEVAPLRRVLVKTPVAAFGDPARIERQWRELGFLARPDLDEAVREHRELVELLERLGARVDLLPADTATTLDSIYVRDAALVCDLGVLPLRMGKTGRRDEPAATVTALAAIGLPVLPPLSGPGTVEGGDVIWLDSRSLAVGRGYRTDAAGIATLRRALGETIDEIVAVPLPHWRGPGDVMHLMSLISPLDTDLALVYAPLLPVQFLDTLRERGVGLVEVPDEELDGLGCNVLAVAPRRCIVVDGNPRTRRRLECAGVETHAIRGRSICHAGSGGPTCLTLPLRRG